MKKFILGLLAGTCLLQILDSLTELLQVAIEIPKGILSKKVIHINNELSKLQSESEPIDTYCVGFKAHDTNYDDDYEYEEDKNKRRFR